MSDIREANFRSRDRTDMGARSYHIRKMTLADLERAIAWAGSEGWNPGLHDAATFYHTDPNGFFMGYVDDQPIASLSAVRYGHTFGFIGFYIVRPSYRGQGYGWQIWQVGMDYLKGRTVGLDGVVAQQANYQQSGFQLAYRNIRYEGLGGKGNMPEPMAAPELLERWSRDIQPVNWDTMEAILRAYDRTCFPSDRPDFLRRWMTQTESHGVALVQDGRLFGYGVVRPCQTGYKIGPLFAETVHGAEAIFLALRQHMDLREQQRRDTEVGRQTGNAIAYPFYLDVPEPNAQAVALAAHYGLVPMFETARMYTPEAPPLPLDRIFGVTTFELG